MANVTSHILGLYVSLACSDSEMIHSFLLIDGGSAYVYRVRVKWWWLLVVFLFHSLVDACFLCIIKYPPLHCTHVFIPYTFRVLLVTLVNIQNIKKIHTFEDSELSDQTHKVSFTLLVSEAFLQNDQIGLGLTHHPSEKFRSYQTKLKKLV